MIISGHCWCLFTIYIFSLLVSFYNLFSLLVSFYNLFSQLVSFYNLFSPKNPFCDASGSRPLKRECFSSHLFVINCDTDRFLWNEDQLLFRSSWNKRMSVQLWTSEKSKWRPSRKCERMQNLNDDQGGSASDESSKKLELKCKTSKPHLCHFSISPFRCVGISRT